MLGCSVEIARPAFEPHLKAGLAERSKQRCKLTAEWRVDVVHGVEGLQKI